MMARIRFGMWALPLSGLLSSIAASIPGVGVDPSVDPAGFARVSSNVGLSNMLGAPIAALLLVGAFALYLLLAQTEVERWIFTGFIFLLVGFLFFLPFLGVYAFAGPAI